MRYFRLRLGNDCGCTEIVTCHLAGALSCAACIDTMIGNLPKIGYEEITGKEAEEEKSKARKRGSSIAPPPIPKRAKRPVVPWSKRDSWDRSIVAAWLREKAAEIRSEREFEYVRGELVELLESLSVEVDP